MTVLQRVVAFARQPSTILGLSTALGTAVAVLTGQVTLIGAIPAFAGSLVAIAVPDNTGLQTAAQRAAAELVAAAETRPAAPATP